MLQSYLQNLDLHKARCERSAKNLTKVQTSNSKYFVVHYVVEYNENKKRSYSAVLDKNYTSQFIVDEEYGIDVEKDLDKDTPFLTEVCKDDIYLRDEIPKEYSWFIFDSVKEYKGSVSKIPHINNYITYKYLYYALKYMDEA